MGYRLGMSGEIRDWLTDLCASDPPAARQAGAALTALMTEGAGLGAPAVTAAAPPGPADPVGALDECYQLRLERLTELRRQVAEAATARERTQPRASAAEEELTASSTRQVQALNAFRTRKEVLKARFAAATAQLAIAESLAVLGQDAGQSAAGEPEAGPDLAASVTEAARQLSQIRKEIAREIARELPDRSSAGPPGQPGPPESPDGLMELRVGAPGKEAARFLFAVEPPGTALLTAVLADPAALLQYDEAVSLSGDLLRRVRAGLDPEAGVHAFDRSRDFLDAFFPGRAADIEAAAAALAATASAGKPAR